MEKRIITTKEEALQYAMDWQEWSRAQSLSYVELLDWQAMFTDLTERYGLVEEFEENGII